MNKFSNAGKMQHTVAKYPAGKLPDELRGEIDPSATVTVTVAISGQTAPRFADIFETLHHDRILSDDPVMRVRALREEWDDRERFLTMIERGGSD